MSDARDKLSAAIAAKKTSTSSKPQESGKSSAPAKPGPAAPPRNAPSPKAAEKPKQKSSFLKKKKKKKAPEAKKSAGNKADAKKADGGGVFGRLAKNFVEEFKEATSEMNPKHLIDSAKEGIQNLVSRDSDEAEGDAPVASEQAGPATKRTSSASPPPGGPSGSSSSPNGGAAGPASNAKAPTSPAKVQRASKKKPKREIEESDAQNTDDVEPGASDKPAASEAAPPSEGAATSGDTRPDRSAENTPTSSHQEAPSAEPPDRDREPESPDRTGSASSDETGEFSPARVQRAATPRAEDEPTTTDARRPVPDEEEASPVATETAREDRSGKAADEVREPEEADVSVSAEEEAGEAQQRGDENSARGERQEEPPKEDEKQEKKKPRRPSRQPVQVSKEEQAVRHFHALHTILNNPTWRKIATNPDAKPSSVFAPRAHFDKQWADPNFRDGLKAASRLATSFSFDPHKTEFNEKTIEAVIAFPLDPQRQIKPHTELITKAIGPKTTEAVLKALGRSDVKLLTYSTGTRLGTFVPTIEILARIYLGLRKKEDIIPGERLNIQEEVLMKYRKSAYTEDMGKKARNLSLNYFMDYLGEYGMKLYTERMARAPEGQNNPSVNRRRHETIKESCTHVIQELGTKVGISSPALMNLEGRFHETADKHLERLIGERPEGEDEDASTLP